ncbi:uncharacterized protein KD926_010322 [Aspergillus affinis]|uniref:uncharacterized protein n=1 Tax=Aspergillus affinis TaxID=1070780 RepID=UPI0022FE4576|nr:uncharacterized protein KD926_010322 [Aspergillus affinis]KAI9044999.1 hypothetical protein KD926_010322 [Aspergillus affinis]
MSTIQPPPLTTTTTTTTNKKPHTIRFPISSTQIPTLNSNHTHPHPHRHPPSTLLHQPSDSPKRSISYTATPTGTPVPSPTTIVNATATATATAGNSGSGSGSATTARQKEKHDDLTCDHKVKGALTELLNDGSVKADERGRRSVQRFLMETERELRTQRRESLGAKGKGKGKPRGRTIGEEMGVGWKGPGNGSIVKRADDEDGGKEGGDEKG